MSYTELKIFFRALVFQHKPLWPQEGWERISHGTGTGYSTISAFWIPDKLPPPPPEKVRGAHSRGGGHASAKLKTHTAFGGKGKRSSNRPSKRASPRNGDAPSGPPEVTPFL